MYREQKLGVTRANRSYIRAYRMAKLERGECLDCANPAVENKSRCSACLRREATKRANERKRDKTTCFDHYGRTCNCCNESYDEVFLTLDHVNNDGAAHRRSISGYNGGGWGAVYKWAIKNNFPSSLQTLCWNCNGAKMVNGGVCPHQQKSGLQELEMA